MPDDETEISLDFFDEPTPAVGPVASSAIEEEVVPDLGALFGGPVAPVQAVPEEEALGDPFSVEPATTQAPQTPIIRTPMAIADDEVTDVTIEVDRSVPDIIKPWMKYHKFELVQSVDKVKEIVNAALKHGRCSLDTECQGLDSRITYDALGRPRTVHQIVGFCISVDGQTGYYIPIRHTPEDGGKNLNVSAPEVEAEITRLCRAAQPEPQPGALDKDPLSFKEIIKPSVVIYFWNAKFDQEMLYPVTGIDWWHPDSFEDGMLAAFCHYTADKGLSLKHKAKDQLIDVEGHPYEMIELKELFPIRGQKIEFHKLSPDEPGVQRYGCSDAICTYLLCEPPRKHEPKRVNYVKLAKSDYEFTYRLEKQVSQVVRVMERYQCLIDRDEAKVLLDHFAGQRDRVLKEIIDFAAKKGFSGLDPSSPKQLSDFLFTDGPGCLNISITPSADYPGGKPQINEASKQYKTDGETLEGMVEANPHAPPILKWIVEYRGHDKTVGTYLEHLYNNPDKVTRELRFNFKQTGAGTGRFSAPAGENEQGFSGVPIHGIPNESSMRKLFLARPGYTFVKCDYAGQELRIAANVSGEPVWINEFLHGDGDLHTITARAFFNKQTVTKDERKMGKIANFALVYGGGPQAIIRATGCDKMEASRRKQAFDKAVPTFAKWIKSQHAQVKKDCGVWTPFKRWLSIPDANHPDKKVQAACERYATNYPIQGSGADIMKISMVMLHKDFYKRGWLREKGDDSVRMILTVHDEIVFEVKHERVTEAIPIIVEAMERPYKMPAAFGKTPWVVPLITEPLVGQNWGSGYKCERWKEGYELKKGEVLVNGFVYGTVRVVDAGKDKPGVGETKEFQNEKQMGIRIVDPPWLRGFDNVSGPATHAPVENQEPVTSEPVMARDPEPASPNSTSEPANEGATIHMRITHLYPHTVDQVYRACFASLDTQGPLLCLTDILDQVLIDPSLGIRVNPEKLADLLHREFNLSDGRFSSDIR